MKGALMNVFEASKIKEDPEGCFAGEDFCEFSEKKPSCYIYFGTALPQSIS